MSLIGDLIQPDARPLEPRLTDAPSGRWRWGQWRWPAILDRRAILRRPALTASGALTLVLVLAGASLSGQTEREKIVAPAPAPYWMEVARPYAMYALQSPEFSKSPFQYLVRRMSDDGVRQDRLIFGAPDERGPYLRILAHRGPIEPGATFFVEAARQASEAGWAVEKLSRSQPLPTRFGMGEYAPLAMMGARGGAGRENCAAFMVDSPDVALRIVGLACGPEGGAFDRRRLSCLVGRLDLLGAGDDLALKTFFAESELYRDPSCPQRAKTAFALEETAIEKKPAVAAAAAVAATPAKTASAAKKR